jgi:hypothetical protein
MRAMGAVLAEIIGLFVDDGALALALVSWCAAVGGAVALRPEFGGPAAGAALLVGSVAILLGNVAHAARTLRPTRRS